MTEKIADLLSKGDVADGHRSRHTAHALLDEFRTDLGLPPAPNRHRDAALEDFLIEVVLGAAWYQKRCFKALTKVWTYIGINIALVVGIPLALIGLGYLAPASNTTIIASQITGVLTGILALQKTLSAWYASQQRYAVWYKASSDLKSIYYAFVQAWAGKTASDPAAFLAALADRTDAARQIIAVEQLDFYQKLALPTFDVLDMLTSTRATVSTFVTSLLPGEPAQTVSVVGRNVTTTPLPAPDPAVIAGALSAGGTRAVVKLEAPGAAKPHDNPYTIVIIANPVIESPINSGMYVPDPILGMADEFDRRVQYVRDSIFGHLPGQAETFAAQFESQIRVISIFDPQLAPVPDNALVAEYELDIVGPVQSRFAPLLAKKLFQANPIVADVVFAITASLTAERSSAFFTRDDDSKGGVGFNLDGKPYRHCFYNKEPGCVALHVSAISIVALHEFGHAASSWTNGSVQDLYYESGLANNPINIRVRSQAGAPVPGPFANYGGTAYPSDPVRDGLGYEAGWKSFHCALVNPGRPAVMDNFWEPSGSLPETCKHDEITVKFLTDRIAAIASRP